MNSGMYSEGTTTDLRPPATKTPVGAIFHATHPNLYYRSDGTNWIQLFPDTSTAFKKVTDSGINPIDALTLDKIATLPIKRPNTIVLLGDSNTQNNSGSSTTSSYYSDKGFFTWANILLGQRFRVLYNAGIGGQVTSQIVARIDTDVLPYKPGWCFLMAGTNDFKDTVSPNTAANVIPLVKAAIEKLTSNNIGVIVSTIFPITNAITAGKKQMDIYNSWLRNEAAFMPNVVFVDMRRVVTDSATSLWKSGCNADELHLNAVGAYLCGVEMYNVLNPIIPKVDVLGCDYTNGGCLNTNPLLAGDTSGVATGWTWYANGATATLSKVARTDGKPGYWQQFVTTVLGSGGFYYQTNTALGTDWAVGDTVYARCEVETDSGYTSGSYNLHIRCRTSANATTMDAQSSAPVAGSWTTIPAGVLETPRVAIPTSTTNIMIQFEPKFIGTCRISRIELIKVTSY